MSLSLSGGLGAILSTFFSLYMPQGHTEAEIVYLLTFPSLFIGIGIAFTYSFGLTRLIHPQETSLSFLSRYGLGVDQHSWPQISSF